ncbi:unnamed protein product [Angiostrongylus costaricensis]|uniref:NADH dehydrogenase [ubiquinone] 1 alpha subcomplex subunit 2 n=1 Tax=Angiostrongylus costaricensis TaxID=334426 RepID=A0A0R3PUA5_ANGCS|nr:unnamed protein product [Angiostrongylus costaricensis]
MVSPIRLAGSHFFELRIHLCQKSSASAGVREFIENDNMDLKKANPHFPILIRECSGIVPFERCIVPEHLPREKVACIGGSDLKLTHSGSLKSKSSYFDKILHREGRV